ncbi:Uncharacterized membrane protein [Devosia crocina]|uniref:Uncharacterized membrane protein n=2 Tax=Devosia crocina TaxID=429728 RepID=A0A1I7N5U5_9HYPH|nr:AzlD family protein [Devosia crocina]SFV30020.1 Uncharacterized membrane protein [Devosia crocina]
MDLSLEPTIVWIVLAAAVATFATRIGGYVLIARFRAIPPRVEAALNAVPAAVLTTLFAPAFFTGGLEIKLAMIAGLLVSLRYPGLIAIVAGWATAMIARHVFGL